MTNTTIDAATRVKTLIALTEELTSIFCQENELLVSRRAKEIVPFQRDKARLAAAYAQSIREVAADRSIVSGAEDILMEQLREITQTFEKRAEEQRVLLDGARLATEGVLKAVAKEAAAVEGSHTYGDNSTNGDDTQRTPALSVNEQA